MIKISQGPIAATLQKKNFHLCQMNRIVSHSDLRIQSIQIYETLTSSPRVRNDEKRKGSNSLQNYTVVLSQEVIFFTCKKSILSQLA